MILTKRCRTQRLSFLRTGRPCARSGLAFLLLVVQATHGQDKYVFTRPAMGSPFTITICAGGAAGDDIRGTRAGSGSGGDHGRAGDSLLAAQAAEAAFRKVDTLNGLLSDYIDSSEINRLSATSGQGRYVRVSAPLFDILQRAMLAAQLSAGRYDITIGPVVRLWRQARRSHVFPDADSIRNALRSTGWKYLHLDTAGQSVWLEKPGMQLDVGGLGKGFVAQAALDLLRQRGFPSAMVNAGGKIVAGLPPPGKTGWLIGINAPGEKEVILPQLLLLREMSVATSGDLYQYVELNGRRYSHIVDPRTGIGLTRRRNVTAIAADGTLADWLATACSILSYRESRRLIKRFPGAAIFVTEKRKNGISAKSSPGFGNYQRK
ncbi:MAG TPA: FAD:protein FMN transferase [Puia sp.]|nr:FAD:protein FMN transferase [Puia sp.]